MLSVCFERLSCQMGHIQSIHVNSMSSGGGGAPATVCPACTVLSLLVSVFRESACFAGVLGCSWHHNAYSGFRKYSAFCTFQIHCVINVLRIVDAMENRRKLSSSTLICVSVCEISSGTVVPFAISTQIIAEFGVDVFYCMEFL